MQKIAVVKISMQHIKMIGVWPKQQKSFGSIPVIETYNLIFHLTLNETKLCVNVFALLVPDFVLAQFDKTLVVLYNCYWMFLMKAKIFQKLFNIQCFLHCCWHTLIFCFWWRKNNCGLLLDAPAECCIGLEKTPRRYCWFLVADISRPVCILLPLLFC